MSVESATPIDSSPPSGWRWYSTPQSIQRGEVSALAIVETLCAMSAALWIAWKYQIVTHIVVSACMAPLLLLRTDRSVAAAIDVYREGGSFERIESAFVHAMDSIYRMRTTGFFAGLVSNTLLLIVAWVMGSLFIAHLMVVRILATAIATISYPVAAFRAIPTNWKRVCWCTDIVFPPEVMPDVELRTHLPHVLSITRFSALMRFPYTIEQKPLKVLMVVETPQAVLFFFGPSFLFRFSIKSTSIIYLPLLFMIRSRLMNNLSVAEQIEDRAVGGIERLQWWYSLVVLLVSALGFFFLELPEKAWTLWIVEDQPLPTLIRGLYFPTAGVWSFKGWHWARLINALIVLLLPLYDDRAKRRLDKGRCTESQVQKTFEAVHIIQIILSIYTIFCSLVWIIKFALTHQLPSIEFQWIP